MTKLTEADYPFPFEKHDNHLIQEVLPQSDISKQEKIEILFEALDSMMKMGEFGGKFTTVQIDSVQVTSDSVKFNLSDGRVYLSKAKFDHVTNGFDIELFENEALDLIYSGGCEFVFEYNTDNLNVLLGFNEVKN